MYSSNQNGFTLIETLIYSAIVAVILGIAVGVSFSLIRANDALDVQTEVVENAKFLNQKVGWALKGASQINSPAVGSSGSTLSINTPSAAFNPFVFDLADGVARLKVGSQTPVPLTSDYVLVASMVFDNFNYSTSSKNTIRLRADIISADPSRPATAQIDAFITVR